MSPQRSRKLEDLVERDKRHDCSGVGPSQVCVRVEVVADLPTRFGHFKVVGFRNSRDDKEHLALVHGDVLGANDVVTRLHSECLTGDTLGSLRCDCRDQLSAALEAVAREKRGIVLYLRQEGRGIGLFNKLHAYNLQDQGLNTLEANRALGFRDDERDYAIAAHMLMSLEVASVALMTNNPDKIEQLEKYGVKVSGRIPHVIPANEFNRFYLETKAKHAGHWLDMDGRPHTQEQGEPVIVAEPRRR